MKLSPTERMSLYMLANLYEKAGLTDPDPELIKAAIEGDCDWAIFYGSIFANEDFTLPLEVKKVVAILEMWNVLELSYQVLDEDAKNKVKSATVLFCTGVNFEGFDGNEEASELTIATFFIEFLNRFSEFKNRDLNAGHPHMDEYRTMLPVFERASKANMFGLLPEDRLIEIGNAAS